VHEQRRRHLPARRHPGLPARQDGHLL
jgi:hypothetical protein